MTLEFQPLLANALTFAFEKATTEGKITIGMLCLVSFFSWTVIITKARQILKARKKSREFFAAFRAARDPLELFRAGREFDGAPAYEVYAAGAEELEFQLKSHAQNRAASDPRVSQGGLESIQVQLERAASAEALSLEKGMIILTTAVAGGPFIGLLGTVWGVMETFSGIAVAKSASLTVMAPGVAGALIATVIGLFVAIPAMFAYNLMVTSIRHITQELENFVAELSTSFEHRYADTRSLGDVVDEISRLLSQLQSSATVAPMASAPPLPESAIPVVEHDLQIP